MAVTASKTWIAGEVLTASDLNGEFINIYGNGETLGWPATVSKNFAGNILILDADGDTTITADTDDLIDIALSGTDLFNFDGTVATPINGFSFVATASGTDPGITTFGGNTSIDFDFNLKGGSNAFLKVNGKKVLVDGAELTEQAILAGQVFG